MNGGSRIIAFGSSAEGQAEPTDADAGVSSLASAEADKAPLDLEAWAEEESAEPAEPARPGILARLPAALALLAVAGWTGFYGWANRTVIAPLAAPAEWISLITDWTLPVLLICVVWLLAMRTSTREANRFGDAARLLSHESALLETRLTTVNRELSLAREFIAAQSRDLESLGRIASERLSANADRLQALVVENSARVESIGSVSETALDNMEKLRGQLPVIASSAKDVTNNIANAGRTAHAQIEDMVRGFKRLNEFGQASETQVMTLREHVNETLVGLAEQSKHLEAMALARFSELTAQGEQLRAQLDRHEIDALAAIRSRAQALVDELESARSGSVEAEREALGLLTARIAALRDEGGEVARTLRAGEVQAREGWQQAMEALDEEIARHAQAHERSADAATQRAEHLTERLASAQTGIERISADAVASQERIDTLLARMGERMAEAGSRLAETERHLVSLTESSLRLFELVHASAEQAGDILPRTFAEADAALAQVEDRAARLTGAIASIGTQGADFASRIDQSRSTLSELAELLDGRQESLRQRASENVELLSGLSARLEQIDESQNMLAEKVRGQLASAVGEMERAARETLATIETQGAAGIQRISAEIVSRSTAVMGKAIHNAIAETSGQLEQAASHAAGVSREATIQLRDQLARVHELVANLENRVDRARERAEEQIDNDFARRAALITEALNSNAIDIAKAFSADVSNTAWQGYLRGDRGIFTRRAVTLIEAAEARAILQIFERDDEFREQVSRYIHDFEAMLRQVLSTRDGNALGVTLLSSDMGKLYVALAQAIERLRK
jgi:hypothetical protein